MTKFEKSVEEVLQRGAERRLAASNVALQKSLRERSVDEVYDSIYRSLGVGGQKRRAVLA